VSPTKLNRNSDAEDKQLGATDRESISQLEDKLEEASDEATLLRDENSKLKDEIAKLKSELASRPPVPVSAEQGAKDAHIEELLRENEHLRTVVTNENVDQAVARERMRAKRECRKEHEHLEAKCVDLETRLEEQTEFSESLERQLIREAEASSSASFADIGRLT
jgi:predicted RNase H-like nuclease (RuvC/YqgF family)